MFSSQSPSPPPLCSSWSILFPLLLHREELLIQALYKNFFLHQFRKNTTEKPPPLERTSEMSEKMTNMTSKQSVFSLYLLAKNCKIRTRIQERKILQRRCKLFSLGLDKTSWHPSRPTRKPLMKAKIIQKILHIWKWQCRNLSL